MSDDAGQHLVRWLDDLDLGRLCTGAEGAPVRTLDAVPETVTVAGVTVRLETYLWRDFMPTCPVDGQPLIASVKVRGEPAVLPPTARAELIVVGHGDEVWVAPLAEEHPGSRNSAGFTVIARHGPKWPPGATVDVVVQLRDETAKQYLVRAGGQLIHETS